MSANTLLTFDVDWAPDWVCFEVSALLERYGVPSTWFVTHPSDHVQYMLERPELYEVGIHPNFLPQSSHGESFKEVFAYFDSFVPAATTMRTHSVFQSGHLLNFVARNTSISVDCSILLRGYPGILPFHIDFGGHYLTRVPFIWADDNEIEAQRAQWHPDELMSVDGVKVFAFHPIHILLNSRFPEHYLSLRSATNSQVASATEADLLASSFDGFGARSFLSSLLERISVPLESLSKPFRGIEAFAKAE